MKKILLICFFLIPTFLFAGPFGLEKGMTLEQITEVCGGIQPEYIENDYYFVIPTKRHPLFKLYIVYVDEKIGLYHIRCMTDSICSNKYGRELKEAFDQIINRISKNYGKPELIDRIDEDNYWVTKDDAWFLTIREGSRVYGACWEPKNKDGLDYIQLEIKTVSGYNEGEGILLLSYNFENLNQIEDEQDSVF